MRIAGVGRINSRCNDLMLAVHVKWIAGERRSCVCRAAVVGRAGPSVVLHGQLLCKQTDTCQCAKPSSRFASCGCPEPVVANHRVSTVWKAFYASFHRKLRRRKCRLFLELSLCLSRACLGKKMIFIYKWRKKCRFSRTHAVGQACGFCPEPFGGWTYLQKQCSFLAVSCPKPVLVKRSFENS